MPGAIPEMRQDGSVSGRLLGVAREADPVRRHTDLDQHAREVGRRPDHVREARGDGAPRHPVVVRLGGVLHHREPTTLLDGLQPEGSIASSAGEHDGDRAVAHVLGERTKESIDGRGAPSVRIGVDEPEFAVVDLQVLARRDHIHVVCLDDRVILNLRHRQLRLRLDQLRQLALVIRREVLDEHERHVRLRRQRREERLERPQPAGRRADPDHRKSHPFWTRHRLRASLRLRSRLVLVERVGSRRIGV